MKNNISSVDRINKVISKFGSITVKHSVKVSNIEKNTNRPLPVGYTYVSKLSAGGLAGLKSISMRDTKDAIIFESTNRSLNNNDKRAQVSVYCSYEDVYSIKELFDTVSAWFIKDEYKNDLFKYDSHNMPFGITQKYETLNATCNIKSGFILDQMICIQPTVVFDQTLNKINYPGIVMKCKNGIIGYCTVMEFFNMKIAALNLLYNLYQNSLLLVNNISTYLISKGDVPTDA